MDGATADDAMLAELRERGGDVEALRGLDRAALSGKLKGLGFKMGQRVRIERELAALGAEPQAAVPACAQAQCST